MHDTSMKPADIRPGSLDAWLVAVRPRSLLVTVSPVLAATALVWLRSGHFAVGILVLALATAVLVQAITNLQNDAGYTARGAERQARRVGLARATANGWLTVAQVRAVIAGCVVATVALGAPVVAERGWPMVAIGGSSLIAALAYMGGPWPIAYTPLGEVVVFLFFGLVATLGTDFAIVGVEPPAATWIVATSLGMLAAAALLVNNCRDIAHDRAVGRRTLPVVAGARLAHRIYAALLVVPFALLAPAAWLARAPTLLLPLLLVPAAGRLGRDLGHCLADPDAGLAFNGVLFRTFQIELQFTALLVAGAVAGRLLGP